MNGKPKRQPALILIVYVLVAVVMTRPVAAQLGTHLPGGGDDLWVHQWTFWWVKESIVKGYNPLHTHLLFYPEGVSLATHNFAWLNIAAWLPLQAIPGSNAAYSLIFIATFALNGFTMFLLARELTSSSTAAFIGSVASRNRPTARRALPALLKRTATIFPLNCVEGLFHGLAKKQDSTPNHDPNAPNCLIR